MTKPRVVHLESLNALRDAAEAWDDLWRRSDATLPSLRAELLAQWIEHFAKPDDFHAIVVEKDGLWMAALPLVRRKIGRLLTAATMPCNEWAASGELLLDASEGKAFSPDADQTTTSEQANESDSPTLAALAEAIRRMPWPLLWLDEVVLNSPAGGGCGGRFPMPG